MTNLLTLGPDLLQAAGALIVLYSSWSTRRKLLPLAMTYDGGQALIDGMQAALIGQFRDQAIGFSAIAGGLIWKLAT